MAADLAGIVCEVHIVWVHFFWVFSELGDWAVTELKIKT
jgi:hypothetical protein